MPIRKAILPDVATARHCRLLAQILWCADRGKRYCHIVAMTRDFTEAERRAGIAALKEAEMLRYSNGAYHALRPPVI